MAKKLALFLDGTWNDLRMKNRTNVSRLAQAVLPESATGVRQVVFYDEGVGVSAGVGKIADFATKTLGGALGKGLDRKVEAAYRFLVLNYEPGDDIYIFGFSRGAFTARSTCGLIRKIGILKRECFDVCPQAFELYADSTQSRRSPATVQFRARYGHDVVSGEEDYAQYLDPAALQALAAAKAPPASPVATSTLEELFQHRDTAQTRKLQITARSAGPNGADRTLHTYRLMYVGLWDTVASMGLPERLGLFADAANSKYRFHDTEASSLISSLRHAVSIDENRKVFSSTPVSNIDVLNQEWATARGFSVGDVAQNLEPDQPLTPGPAYVPYRFRPYQQRWFPGDHGAVGGGNPVLGLSSHTLRWIAEGAAWAGLEFNWTGGQLEDARTSVNPLVDWPERRKKNLLGNLGGYSNRSGPKHIRELGDTAYERYCRAPEEIPANARLMAGQPGPRPRLPPPPTYPANLPMA
ncbi:DUF2235 domain-containing protein [Caulobacter sp. ErkDOM-E]|uniref:DUF2235 domain-containing protein n=1 Tax=Caulobacter sp. ErkDOM-E TaxID=3402778 RepID=UPI003AF88BC4